MNANIKNDLVFIKTFFDDFFCIFFMAGNPNPIIHGPESESGI